MGQKVHPLIFRGLIYKNYLNNFYINISKNKYYLINILLTYFIYYIKYIIKNIFKIKLINYNNIKINNINKKNCLKKYYITFK